MSHILQQEDNITILGDLYSYPVYKGDTEEVKEKRDAIHLQIIIVVNGKQKIFRTNYDVDIKQKGLEDYNAYTSLMDFIEAIGYKVTLNISNKLEEMIEEI